MTKTSFIANRLREVLLNGKWIANTNFKEQIESTTWQQAITKAGDLNTIAALTYHIDYYLDGLLSAFATGRLEIRDKYSFDLPPIASAADWEQLVARFINDAIRFADAVEQMDDSLLDEPFIDAKYGTYYRNLEGVIEHSYYHLGQISLIRKMAQQAAL